MEQPSNQYIFPGDSAGLAHPELERIHNLLDLLRRRWFWLTLARVGFLWLAILAAGTATVLLAAGLLTLTEPVRWCLLGLWLLTLAAGPILLVYLAMVRQPEPLALAYLADQHGGAGHNFLVNALQLAQDSFWPAALVARIVSESASAAGAVRPETVLPVRRLRKPAVATAGVVMGSVLLLVLAYGPVRVGYDALVRNGSAKHAATAGRSDQPALPANYADWLEVQTTARFPQYLQRVTQPVAEKPGPMHVPEGTILEMTITCRQPVQTLRLEMGSGSAIPAQADPTGTRFRVDWSPTRSDTYWFSAQYESLRLRWPDRPGQSWPVTVVVDRPPTVRLPEPGQDLEISPGSKVRFTLVAEDDYGLLEAAVIVGTTPAFQTRPEKARYTNSFEWTVPRNTKIGTALEVFARVKDNRSLPGKGSQETRTPAFKIRIVSLETFDQRQEASRESLRERIQEILRRQIRCRADTLARKLDGVAREQKAIRGGLEELARGPFPAGLTEFGRVLTNLSKGPAREAAELAAGVSPDNLKKLLDAQEEIVLTLESLLQMLSAEADPKETTTKAAGAAAENESFKDLADLLGKFIEQQRLALRTAQELSGKTPEDFSGQDKARLDQLAQLQEKWDRFLQQAVSDVDILAKQDFSASVAKEELVEIQSQVQLAEDALKKQAVHMAVKAEEVGLELAKELVRNLERWMANAPDNLKWDLEEPPAPIDVPLAELPEELEDIVGELIEKEEDFYDEIEDVTSSWADSLDAGAGWDVMDGPISNFSAKGITGNILPNQSEIGGRSGEGRTGRSSGEFVERTAQGKGGRRTPTRLTNDAIQSGQVDDRSKEPAGGATGGGKLSGAGAEGLTGPRTNQPMPNLPALQQKQALLLSKAKMAQWQATKNRWGNFDLEKAVRLMAQNQSDLDRGAYRSVVARRSVLLGTLKTSRSLIAGKFQLDAPETRLPKNLQAQIQSNDPQAIPETLRPLLDSYYRILADPQTKNPK